MSESTSFDGTILEGIPLRVYHSLTLTGSRLLVVSLFRESGRRVFLDSRRSGVLTRTFA